ncbi:alcohol dehydrogenase, propanol-preferring [Zhouia amylolytica]|uniref:Alcohol dehydrogenase, propanol-preferring n=1 Tax=Zhouia amylolytica TaxID=376730 RepID=A0A1I6V4H5_9FLAO|nr:zinc-dependent alcohol dehydrogenase family protein [Zhouia amylolytica]SFT08506.1 alcohol dehydrogenase, propanol-preferring [Zhouia amylolytica]
MKAMILKELTSLEENQNPLELVDIPIPVPKPNELLIKVSFCGVCHTELDEIEGRTPPPRLPIIPGHQAIGVVEKIGRDCSKFKVGDRVGVAWIYNACGTCWYCLSGQENLCDHFQATGRDVNGGYAEYMTANEKHTYSIPSNLTAPDAAPLLCAGAIGYRSLLLSGVKNNQILGLTGFGASGHLVMKLVKHLYPQTKVYVFARNESQRNFARSMGAEWCGDITEKAPEKANAIIDTTPVWKPVIEGLDNLQKGGRFIINAIRKQNTDKEYLLKLSYKKHMWMEKEIKTVANITGKNVDDFLKIASIAAIKPTNDIYPLEQANVALLKIYKGASKGSKVLQINP